MSEVDWEAWFNTPGMPLYRPNYDESLAKVCQELSKKWIEWDAATPSPFKPEDIGSFSSGQKIEFLSLLLTEKPLRYLKIYHEKKIVKLKLFLFSIAKLEEMEKQYSLNGVRNSEIRFNWIRLGLVARWEDAVPRAVAMVTEQGRMKFLRPLYRLSIFAVCKKKV